MSNNWGNQQHPSQRGSEYTAYQQQAQQTPNRNANTQDVIAHLQQFMGQPQQQQQQPQPYPQPTQPPPGFAYNQSQGQQPVMPPYDMGDNSVPHAAFNPTQSQLLAALSGQQYPVPAQAQQPSQQAPGTLPAPPMYPQPAAYTQPPSAQRNTHYPAHHQHADKDHSGNRRSQRSSGRSQTRSHEQGKRRRNRSPSPERRSDERPSHGHSNHRNANSQRHNTNSKDRDRLAVEHKGADEPVRSDTSKPSRQSAKTLAQPPQKEQEDSTPKGIAFPPALPSSNQRKTSQSISLQFPSMYVSNDLVCAVSSPPSISSSHFSNPNSIELDAASDATSKPELLNSISAGDVKVQHGMNAQADSDDEILIGKHGDVDQKGNRYQACIVPLHGLGTEAQADALWGSKDSHLHRSLRLVVARKNKEGIGPISAPWVGSVDGVNDEQGVPDEKHLRNCAARALTQAVSLPSPKQMRMVRMLTLHYKREDGSSDVSVLFVSDASLLVAPEEEIDNFPEKGDDCANHRAEAPAQKEQGIEDGAAENENNTDNLVGKIDATGDAQGDEEEDEGEGEGEGDDKGEGELEGEEKNEDENENENEVEGEDEGNGDASEGNETNAISDGELDGAQESENEGEDADADAKEELSFTPIPRVERRKPTQTEEEQSSMQTEGGDGSKVNTNTGTKQAPARPTLQIEAKQSTASKLRTLSISLAGLLEYDESDNDERSFEINMLAETIRETCCTETASTITSFLEQKRPGAEGKETQAQEGGEVAEVEAEAEEEMSNSEGQKRGVTGQGAKLAFMYWDKEATKSIRKADLRRILFHSGKEMPTWHVENLAEFALHLSPAGKGALDYSDLCQ